MPIDSYLKLTTKKQISNYSTVLCRQYISSLSELRTLSRLTPMFSGEQRNEMSTETHCWASTVSLTHVPLIEPPHWGQDGFSPITLSKPAENPQLLHLAFAMTFTG